ncbi:MAG: hypothetical protein K0S42_840 [Microvirga sp.]|nr:hypothetical protein [Microvirga sp.]
MIRSSLTPLAALAVLTAIGTSPASAQSACGPGEQLVKLLADQYKEDPVGMGLSQPGQILEVFASSNGSWTMVMTMPDGRACLIAAGDNWEMVTRVKGSPV